MGPVEQLKQSSPLAKLGIGSGDVRITPYDGYFMVTRSRRRAKARGSKSRSLQVPMEHVTGYDVSFMGDSGHAFFGLAVDENFRDQARSEGWTGEDLIASVPNSDRDADVLQAMMGVWHRFFAPIPSAPPAALEGLNGSVTRDGESITVSPNTSSAWGPQLGLVREMELRTRDVVDSYLFNADRVLYLMIVDERAAISLLAGDASVAMGQAVIFDQGDWQAVAAFYEQLPRHADRAAMSLEQPSESSVAPAYQIWKSASVEGARQRHDTNGLEARLQKLAELHADGALTEDEFTAAKQRILGND